MSQICKEIELLAKLDHPNIVKIYEYYIYTHDIFIVMEYLNGGELFEKLTTNRKALNEKVMHKIMKELMSALAYMHNLNIGRSHPLNYSEKSTF